MFVCWIYLPICMQSSNEKIDKLWLSVLQVKDHSNTDVLKTKKQKKQKRAQRAQKHAYTHTNIFSIWVCSNLNNHWDFTSSVCRWAWLLRWGTGGTRWHRPDTERLVPLHLCYLQGGGREAGLLTTCPSYSISDSQAARQLMQKPIFTYSGSLEDCAFIIFTLPN